jgi:phosphoribosylglycinamide formyltransferase-1
MVSPGPLRNPRSAAGPVVLLAGSGDSTDIVANYLAAQVRELVVVVEEPPSRLRMARRRAHRVGWLEMLGQLLFVGLLQPILTRRGTPRRIAILRAAGVDTTHRPADHRVSSVNDPGTVSLVASLHPTLVVVHGTRIIASTVLKSMGCPAINLHAGITPRYRGVHGGYWALVDSHPEWVGSTVHLVDPGIDTGSILGQTTFEVSAEDTFATYPDLHLVHGLPLLGTQVSAVMAGEALRTRPVGLAPGSGLHYHPTLWGYLWHRWRRGVR